MTKFTMIFVILKMQSFATAAYGSNNAALWYMKRKHESEGSEFY